jgi:parvulin-like peptidyl-prolyl isomerase
MTCWQHCLFASPIARQPRRYAATSAAIFSFVAANLAFAQSPTSDPVVAKVNNVEIHQSDLAIAAEDVGPNNPGTDENAKRDFLINYLLDMNLLAKEAEDEKIFDEAEMARRARFAHHKSLMERMLARAGAAAISEEKMRAAYDEAVKQAANETEVHARHILFRIADAKDEASVAAAQAKARAAAERIRNGEDFSAVAKELTEDQAGKQNGGDLAYFAKGRMAPEFSEAAFNLQVGDISEPIKTVFGWHIINVLDRRPRKAPAFDIVRPQLQAYLVRKAQIEMVNSLRAKASIERTTNTKP